MRVSRSWPVSALIGGGLTLPFLLLELSHQTAPFPTGLFVILWSLGTGLALAFRFLWRNWRSSGRGDGTSGRLLLGLGAFLLLAALWGSILADQLPCFLGRPNCD